LKLDSVSDAVGSVAVEPLNRTITERTIEEARQEGERRRAAIVIWGRYNLTDTHVGLSVHFTVIHPSRDLPPLSPVDQGQLIRFPIRALKDFTLQNELSKGMTHLSLLVVGLVRLDQWQLTTAIRYFTAALGQSPACRCDQGVLYFLRAIAYELNHDYKPALYDIDKAIQMKVFDPGYSYGLRSFILDKLGKTSAALIDANRAIALHARSPDPYSVRAFYEYDRHHYQQAISDAKKAIALDSGTQAPGPGSSIEEPMVMVVGRSYFYLRDYAASLKWLDRFISHNTSSEVMYEYRAYIYQRNRNYTAAISDLSRAIELAPKRSDLYLARASAYNKIHQIDSAIADARLAMQYADTPKDRKYAREWLKYLKAD
jgi:tetratricopeptide (TPR) repeat protein